MTGIDALLRTAVADRYRIERELGAGGMATVYLAHDLRHDRDVAIKVLHSDLAVALGTERFLREIQIAARLSHPNILSLFDSGEAAGTLYFVMPRVEGASLRERLNQVHQLPVEEAARLAREVAEALDHAHRHGVAHRDIKPENIMLHEGHALAADFGIGKALSAVEGEAFTRAGMSVGTRAYMSPEQAAGDAVDGRSDIYSLGCVLYEMLVGEQPFTGPTVLMSAEWISPTQLLVSDQDGYRPSWLVVDQGLVRSTPSQRCAFGAWIPDERRLTCNLSMTDSVMDPDSEVSWVIRSRVPTELRGRRFLAQTFAWLRTAIRSMSPWTARCAGLRLSARDSTRSAILIGAPSSGLPPDTLAAATAPATVNTPMDFPADQLALASNNTMAMILASYLRVVPNWVVGRKAAVDRAGP